MTLTDYAKYLLSVCGRRFTHLYRRHYLESTPTLPSLSALLSYIKTQTASIYAYLQTRFAGDPTSGIPSITPTQPLTFANLLPNLQKLATRKIDAGASTQIPDGISLVRLLCDTTAASAVTELIDTNTGWSLSRNILSLFPNIVKFTFNCQTIVADSSGNAILNISTQNNTIKEIHLPNATSYPQRYDWYQTYCFNCPNLEVFDAPKLKTIGFGHSCSLIPTCQITTLILPEVETISNLFLSGNTTIKELLLPKCKSLCTPVGSSTDNWKCIYNCTALEKVVLGKITTWGQSNFMGCTSLIYLEIGEGTDVSMNMKNWSPTNVLSDDTNRATFLTNFRQYLFLRLADRTATTALTLTLSSAVYTALTTETSTLAELGITTLTDKEQAAGITLATAYNTWLDTYRAAINWNITNAG